MWNSIPQIFPEMEFSLQGGKWCSGLHFDGSKPSHAAKDKSVITPSYPHKVYDQSRGSKSLLDLYIDLHNLDPRSDIFAAVCEICKIVGLQEPQNTPEEVERYRKSEKRRTALELSLERQKKALFAPEGSAVLNYLHGRGWTDEEIQRAELGFISAVEASTINAQRNIGEEYTLSIPLRSGGQIYSFKFRSLLSKEESIARHGSDKRYIYLYKTDADRYGGNRLFNLTGIKQREGRIVVVEGELDALHAKVKGLDNIVATSGGALTEELLQQAINRGIKRIILLFDADERGRSFTVNTIQRAHKLGVSVFVATYPEEQLQDGRRIHDIDEYLLTHPVEDLQQLINNAMHGGIYLLYDLFNKATAEAHGAEIQTENGTTVRNFTDEDIIKLRDDVIELANQIPDEVERSLIFAECEVSFSQIGVTREAIQAVADRKRAESNILLQKRQTDAAIKEIEDLQRQGDTLAALAKMKEASETITKIDRQNSYKSLLALPSELNFTQRIGSKQGDLYTPYEFKSERGDKEVFTLPSGAITFVVAATSHGKSTFLQNIALHIAKSDQEGTVLYFSFEEDGDEVTLQILNKYIGEELCRNYSATASNNLRAIKHYFKTGEDRYIAQDKKSLFNQKREEFFSSLYTSGRLRIFYEDYDSTALIEAIRYLCSQIKVKAVFIDYIQLLSKNGNRKQRTEELKEICGDLKNLCVENKLPIVVAAQANREVTSPLEMHSQKIAEASDLERIANKILFFWNSSFAAQKSKDIKGELESFETRTGIKLGSSGKIYAKLTKNRGGVVGLEAVLNYNGNTGIIEANHTPETPQQLPLFNPFAPQD